MGIGRWIKERRRRWRNRLRIWIYGRARPIAAVLIDDVTGLSDAAPTDDEGPPSQ